MKFTTEIGICKSGILLCPQDRITILGSCFSEGIGSHLKDAGFNVRVNPFGVLYNPESIAAATARLGSGEPFTEEDCVPMGAGAGLICSFSHHSSFARPDADGFLENANARLREDSLFWKQSNKVIITLGTAFVWRHCGKTVSNCLKRPAREFTREMLDCGEISSTICGIVESNPDKEFIFTVSPIRHLSDGAHSNTISKASLHLGLQKALEYPGTAYFPAYELLMDELRDYRFYAADLVHPRDIAVDYIWERFVEFCVPDSYRDTIKAAEKAARHAMHRPINYGKA